MGNSADEIVAKVVAALDQRGDSAKAAQAGLERETIFQLARRIRPEVIGFEQAVKELENAVATALDVIAKVERGSNQETFVEDKFKRLAETTKKGDFDGGAKTVDDALAELEWREDEHRAAYLRSREFLLEAGVEQDLLRRDAASVARRIEAIAALNTNDSNPTWSKTYRQRFDAYLEEGEDKGINLSLEVAVEMARRTVELARNKDERGTALVLLGAALTILGERESGTETLQQALEAYREALKEFTRERLPLRWAFIQMNVGNAFSAIGEKERGTTLFTGQAIAAYHEALKEYTRKQAPLDWATTQMNLGTAFHALGITLHAQGAEESARARLEDAVFIYHEALQELTRERVPLQWAMTQMNLGNSLERLGEWESEPMRLEQAVVAYREALEENAFERVPLQWAKTIMNLGIALVRLGEWEGDPARLEQAVAAFHGALQESTRERVPPIWAATQNNLGLALEKLGEQISSTARLEEAAAAYRQALEENTRVRVPFLWAQTQENLASVYLTLFRKDHQPFQLDAAREAVNAALEEFCKAEAQFFIEKAERLRQEILAAKSNV